MATAEEAVGGHVGDGPVWNAEAIIDFRIPRVAFFMLCDVPASPSSCLQPRQLICNTQSAVETLL